MMTKLLCRWLVVLTVLACNVAQGQDRFDFSPAGRKAKVREANEFVADPKNKGAQFLGEKYFYDKATTEYQTSVGQKYTLAGDDKIVAALVVAKAMRQVLADPMSQNDLETAWRRKQIEVINVLGAGDDFDRKILQEGPKEAWRQFLTNWAAEVVKKDEKKFKDALMEAAYEIVNVILHIDADQKLDAKSSSNAFGSTTATGLGGATSAAYFPVHERMMNHIYRHNDRQLGRAERIRARR